MAKVFVSFNYLLDGVRRNDLQSLIANPEVGQRHSVVTVGAVPDGPKRDERIRAAIKEKMEGADVFVCLVGDNSHNSPWIEYEAELADQWQIPMVVVQGSNTTGGPPYIIAKRELEVVPWGAKKIASAIDRAAGTRS